MVEPETKSHREKKSRRHEGTEGREKTRSGGGGGGNGGARDEITYLKYDGTEILGGRE